MARITLMSTSAVTWTEVTRVSERGVLEAIGIGLPLGLAPMGVLNMVIGARLGGDDDEVNDSIFFAGPVSNDQCFLWTGAYHLEPFELLFARAVSIVTLLITVNFKIALVDP